MKKDVHLKGMLRLYMRWPAVMSILLIVMNLWIYSVDKRAGVIMSLFVAVYVVIVGVLYFYTECVVEGTTISLCNSFRRRADNLAQYLLFRSVWE